MNSSQLNQEISCAAGPPGFKTEGERLLQPLINNSPDRQMPMVCSFILHDLFKEEREKDRTSMD